MTDSQPTAIALVREAASNNAIMLASLIDDIERMSDDGLDDIGVSRRIVDRLLTVLTDIDNEHSLDVRCAALVHTLTEANPRDLTDDMRDLALDLDMGAQCVLGSMTNVNDRLWDQG